MNQSAINSIALLIARLTIGMVFFAHGSQKIFGWFGGFGFRGTFGYFRNTLGVPALLAVAGVVAEFAVGMLFIVGVWTGTAAVIAIVQMLFAIYLSHAKDGFFINYFGQLPAGREGFEYNIVLIGFALVLLFEGAGRYSLDNLWNLDVSQKLLSLITNKL